MRADEIEARELRIAAGIEHRGECQQVFTATGEVCGNFGRLLKCHRDGCGVLICFGCRLYHGLQHNAEVAHAAS